MRRLYAFSNIHDSGLKIGWLEAVISCSSVASPSTPPTRSTETRGPNNASQHVPLPSYLSLHTKQGPTSHGRHGNTQDPRTKTERYGLNLRRVPKRYCSASQTSSRQAKLANSRRPKNKRTIYPATEGGAGSKGASGLPLCRELLWVVHSLSSQICRAADTNQSPWNGSACPVCSLYYGLYK